jgi:hypothetical protein
MGVVLAGLGNQESFSLNYDGMEMLIDLLKQAKCDTSWLEEEEATIVPESVANDYAVALANVIETLEVFRIPDTDFVDNFRLVFSIAGGEFPPSAVDRLPLRDFPETLNWLSAFTKFCRESRGFSVG